MKKEMKNTIILYSHELFGNLRVAIQPDSKCWEIGFVAMDIMRMLGFNENWRSKNLIAEKDMKVINGHGWDYYCGVGGYPIKSGSFAKLMIINQHTLDDLLHKIELDPLSDNIDLPAIQNWIWCEVMSVARSRVRPEDEEATLQSFNRGKGNSGNANDKDADKAYTQATSEELPALHKIESHTANPQAESYTANPQTPNSKADFDDTAVELIAKYILLAQKELKEEREKTQTLKAVNSYLAERLMSLQAKTDHYNKSIDNTGHADRTDHFTETSIKSTAVLFGIKWERFMEYLYLQGYLYKDKTGTLLPYDRYLEQGLFTVKHYYNQHCDIPDMQTLITSKGRDYFRSILMDDVSGEISGLDRYKRKN